jgi:hypothetical protein
MLASVSHKFTTCKCSEQAAVREIRVIMTQRDSDVQIITEIPETR